MSAHAARPTTSLKTLPADARTAFAPNGSAHPASTTSAGAPVAAAVRQMAPTLPGSCTRSSTTSGQPASRAARAASAGVASCTRTTAITPWGETVWVAARYAAGVSVTRDSEWNGSLSPSRTAMSSKSSPAALASLSTRGPSRRARPGSRRWARRRSRRTTSLSGLLISGWLEVVLGNLHQPGKGTAVAHGQVSQHLAVDLHTGLAKAVHQLVVGQTRLPRRGVDPGDPQAAHLALAPATVAIGVSEGVQDGLVGRPEQELLGKPEALGGREDHEEVSALEQRLALDDRERLGVVRDAIEDPPTDILMDHLAAPEHDRHLDLLSCFEELSQTLELGLEIVLGDLRPQLHLLQLGDVLLAALVFL